MLRHYLHNCTLAFAPGGFPISLAYCLGINPQRPASDSNLDIISASQDVGFLDNDNTSGPDFEPENYLLYSGLSADTDNVLGDYTAVVELFRGSGSIPWKLTATSNGEELWVEEGDFADIDGDSSTPFTATVTDYIDNGCANTSAARLVEISGDSDKYQSTP